MKISRDEQLALVGEQEQSGQPALAFCRERGICYQSFLRWRKRVSGHGVARHGGHVAFVEFAVRPEDRAQAPQLAAELALGGGIVLKIFAPLPGR